MILSKINVVCRISVYYNYLKSFFFSLLVGDLNALCTKDTDCQRYMICLGMTDGTRQCQCQRQFNYDDERRRCRKYFIH